MKRAITNVRRIAAAAAVVALASAGLVGVGTSSASAASSGPIATGGVFQIASPYYSTPGLQKFADGANVQLYVADTTRGIDARMTVPNSGSDFTLTPAPGEPLTTGVYQLVGNDAFNDTVPTLEVDGTYFVGELDITDIASNPANGAITRFDAVMAGVGEFRFGEDSAGAVVAGARTVVFGSTFVGLPKTVRSETIHNTGTKAISFGAPVVSGQSASSFGISANTCGSTLAAGAACTFVIGFAPTVAGPASAFLNLTVGGVKQVVSLAGTAALGTTAITSSGNDSIDHGTTTNATQANTLMTVRRTGGGWIFDARSIADTPADTVDVIQVYVVGPGDGPLPLGTRATTFDNGYSVVDTVGTTGCDTEGTETVKQFHLDANGVPDLVDMTFSQRCNDETAVQTGSIEWQARTDITSPVAPTAVTISSGSTRTASWKSSASSDVKTVFARLVQGDGAGATPVSGRPLAVLAGTSASLPTVPSGQQYSVVVFAVDSSGNVSPAAVARFGTPPVVVTAPGAPTITKVIAGKGAVTVFFSPPTNTGGLPITGYEVDAYTGLHKATGTTSPITVTGMPGGYPAQFRVLAINAAGRGQMSYLSASVTPTK